MANHAVALSIVNQTQRQLATTARAIVDALKDGKVTPMEGMMLGMQGMNLATNILALVQGVDVATRDDVLYVLEHGEWHIKE